MKTKSIFDSAIEEQRQWSPLSPLDVQGIFKDADFPWWIAGGYAIEDFVGHSYREHDDIDILVLRSDLQKIREKMKAWQMCPSDPPGTLREWKDNEVLPDSVRDIWGRKSSESDWAFQIMVNDCKNNQFIYKRDSSIQFDIESFTRKSANGISYLAPELQLLYKGKSIREKDNTDFQACFPLLDSTKQDWLKGMLAKCYSSNHPWLNLVDEEEMFS